MHIVLITGLSGSGKSVALGALEDAGYYCVDNLPLALLPQLAGLLAATGNDRIALSMDARSGGSLENIPQHLADIRAQGADIKILFLDARNETLLKRFSETRRRHPLSDGQRTLLECISRERELLQELAALSHHMDTSELNPNALRGWVRDFIGLPGSGLILLFQSFGFKHGIPLDSDLVFDVRCLPNPHYDPVLRPLTGRDGPVITFLSSDPLAQKMLEDVQRFVSDWLPHFDRDNRSYLTVALGCTGGRHRSVYLTEKLAATFRPERRVIVRHRELC